MFRKLALSVFTITIMFLLTACGGFTSQKRTPRSSSNDQVATTTSVVKKAKSLIKEGRLDDAHQILKNEQKKAAKNTEVNQLLTSVDKLTIVSDALKDGNSSTAKAELTKARASSNSQEVATRIASFQQQASQLEKANTLFSTIQINLNQKNIGAAQNANEELQAINVNLAKVVEIKQQAAKLMQGQEEATTSSDNTASSGSSGMNSQQMSSTQNFSNQEMTTVLNNFRAASGIAFNAETQFNLTKISAEVYQIDVKNIAAKDSNNPTGTYRYNIKSGIVQKMNPETGSFGGK
ncbi:hypothetical protein [Pediococcus claussenii]|nr:hypothetical protein [Pediococcus claussenii]KRN19759.1 hypothetical protein IV79_GL001046 [Pediococcus claussenii]